MKITSNRKLAAVLFTILILLGSFSMPKKASAVLGAGDTVIEVGPNLVENTLNTVNTTAISLDSYYQRYKGTVLDRLATMAAKQLIRQITASVVNWINSGFQGSPSFLQNPGSFFLDVADQVTGEFLATTGGPLTGLCSPFSINIRLALAFKYHPQIQKRYACTLGTIIQNSKNAVKNASINGFTAGDFKQGGWPAFISLTTEPQNNVYGAYLEAESELSWKVVSAQAQQKDEISAGRGFLSWRDPSCLKDVKTHNDQVQNGTYQSEVVTAPDGTQGSANVEIISTDTCPIQTPGSVIAGTLQNHLDGPLRELELVDNINQIVDALFAQLAVQVLKKGLGTVSGSSGGNTSYINATVAEANKDNSPDVEKARTDIINSVNNSMKSATEYQLARNSALAVISSAKDAYDNARTCYTNKINKIPPPSSYVIATANDRIKEIDTAVNDNVTSKFTSILALSNEADGRITTLNNIIAKANAANTLTEVGDVSTMFANLLNSGGLTTPVDIQKAKDDLGNISDRVSDYKNDANQKLQMCNMLQ